MTTVRPLYTAPALLVAGILLATPTLANAASTFASYNTTTTGVLNGVGFTISGLDTASPTVKTGSFTGTNYNDAGSQSYVDFNQDFAPTFTITFDSAVSNLEFYAYYLRGSNGDGYDSYTFSESFSVAAGMTGLPVSGNTVDTSSTQFVNGILSFAGPVTSLTITTTGDTGEGFAGFTMAQGAGSPAVPGIGGVAALAAVGCGRRRRR